MLPNIRPISSAEVRRIRRGECVCTSTVGDGLRPHAVPVCEVKTDAALKTLQVNQTAAEVGFEDDRWCIDDDLQFDHTSSIDNFPRLCVPLQTGTIRSQFLSLQVYICIRLDLLAV
jgi:hypothetical protein